MTIIAIDPGNERSAYVVFNGTVSRRGLFGIVENERLLQLLEYPPDHPCDYFGHLAIETLKPRGMPTSFEEMQTQLWAGRFIQAWGKPFTQVFRHEVKMHVCGRATAKDSNIRQALIDRWGGKEKAIGKKANPGPLYGIKDDLWSALAIAVTWLDTHEET